MIYYVRETADTVGDALGATQRQTAAFKPRVDVDTVLSHLVEHPVSVPFSSDRSNGIFRKFARHEAAYRAWTAATAPLSSGDVLVLQFPLLRFFLKQNKLFRRLKKRGVSLVLFVHDVNCLREAKESFFQKIKSRTEMKTLHLADAAVVHNESMADALRGSIHANLVCLGIFDYLAGEALAQRAEDRKALPSDPIIIAGNLAREKAQYAYALPQSVQWNLYGPHYEGTSEGVHYFGAFAPEELPFHMEGSFGLVWDGTSSDACSGAYGEYLRYNAPYKCSLYLACGIPVIIWREAALAPFILENDCGLVVDSLHEISAAVASIGEERYQTLCRNANEVGKRLRSGYYTEKALKQLQEGDLR